MARRLVPLVLYNPHTHTIGKRTVNTEGTLVVDKHTTPSNWEIKGPNIHMGLTENKSPLAAYVNWTYNVKEIRIALKGQ